MSRLPFAPAAVLVAALGAVLSSGCGGKLPPITVWSLAPPPLSSPGTELEGPALGLGRFSSELELRTTWLTWREAEGRRLNHYDHHQWSDFPDRLVRARVEAELLRSRAFSSVTRSPPMRGLDAVLEGRLVEFDEWDRADGVRVSVGLSWRLEGPDGALLVAERTRVERTAAKSVPAVVEAFDLALAELSEAVTTRVREALAARP